MDSNETSRREFLRAGAAAAAAASVAPAVAMGADQPAKPKGLPVRKLGRTGVDVTILNQGSAFSIGARHLNIMHEEGVRYIDTADCYKGGRAERACGEWLNQSGHRKEYFLVTKDHPQTPDEWVTMLDRRLENAQQDYVDLYFLHGMGDAGFGRFPMPASQLWPKQKAWAKAAERIKKSGKAKFVGLSTHCNPITARTQLLNNAVKGGWVDAIMVAVTPTLLREDAKFNKAIDACAKADIGLISMKESRGGLAGIEKIFPEFKARGLSPVTAVLTAMWTDERFATICSHMDNIEKLKENATAARNFKPMTATELTAVHQMMDGHAKGFCIGCDGSCRRAAGTETAFSDIARYLCYCEENGDREGARQLFAALPPAARDWSKADLRAASEACCSKLDFESILARAAEQLA
ncbi:MAG: aldo/keto reductase [bacterium]|nr:aldo/keto reductase [bacterium]